MIFISEKKKRIKVSLIKDRNLKEILTNQRNFRVELETYIPGIIYRNDIHKSSRVGVCIENGSCFPQEPFSHHTIIPPPIILIIIFLLSSSGGLLI